MAATPSTPSTPTCMDIQTYKTFLNEHQEQKRILFLCSNTCCKHQHADKSRGNRIICLLYDVASKELTVVRDLSYDGFTEDQLAMLSDLDAILCPDSTSLSNLEMGFLSTLLDSKRNTKLFLVPGTLYGFPCGGRREKEEMSISDNGRYGFVSFTGDTKAEDAEKRFHAAALEKAREFHKHESYGLHVEYETIVCDYTYYPNGCAKLHMVFSKIV